MTLRFEHNKCARKNGNYAVSVILFLITIVCLLLGLRSLSENAYERQYESLQKALERDITYCYAMEGYYPESLAKLREQYGLTYDESLFYVDYRTYGSNIRPEVTIIEKQQGVQP